MTRSTQQARQEPGEPGEELAGTAPERGPGDAPGSAGRDRGRRGGRRLGRRLTQLYAGLALYGISMALMLRAGLGLDPWDAFHQGVSERTGISIGMVANLTGLVVLLLWLPLRQRPGLGTVSNVLLIGSAMDATLLVLPRAEGLLWQVPTMAGAVLLNGMATGMYIAAEFGPGPRDGVMTALHRVTGRSIRLMRTCVELTVLAIGVALGGSAGLGTVVYALAIGPLAQFFLRVFALERTDAGMDFEERRRPGNLRPWSRRMRRYPEPSCADAG